MGIEVSTGKKVRIKFTSFDMQMGVDYGITTLYPAYNLNNQDVNCNVGVARTSCAECPNPLKPDSFGNRVCDGGNCDFAWCTGGGHCQIKRFATDGNFGGTAKLVDFCVNANGITDAPNWCHGNNDFLQVDGKSMFNYTDIGSAQNRFCGKSLPRIGGIKNPPYNHVYISESNQLVLWFKSNLDSIVGKGFQLDWMGYDCPTDRPNLSQAGTCVETCPDPDFNDQGTCVTNCPTGRVTIGKTCVTTCPDQGTCMTNCIADTTYTAAASAFNRISDTRLLDQTTCTPACPPARPYNDRGTCVADCPTARPDDNGDMLCDCPNENPLIDQGTLGPNSPACVENCPFTCVTTCPSERPFTDQGTCVATCPPARPDTNVDMICGN